MVVFLLGLVLVVGASPPRCGESTGCAARFAPGRKSWASPPARKRAAASTTSWRRSHVTHAQFPGTDGAIVYFEHKQGSKPRFRVGDRLRIRYHRTDPR